MGSLTADGGKGFWSRLSGNDYSLEAAAGFEPAHKGFADLPLSHLGTPPRNHREAKNSLTPPLHNSFHLFLKWSGRRDSNPRPQPWQGCALPLSYARMKLLNFPRGLLINRKSFSLIDIRLCTASYMFFSWSSFPIRGSQGSLIDAVFPVCILPAH